MNELSVEEKAQRYDEAIEVIDKCETDKYGCIIGVKPTDIFPELKEPEDERIRNFLHHTFTEEYLSEDKLSKWHGEPVANILAWLEKKGEQKPTNKCEGCNNAKGCVACVDGSEWAHIEEQNPAWSEEDERNLNDAILFIETGTYSLDKDNLINWLKSLRPQPKQRWSEEDALRLEEVICMIEANGRWVRSDDAVKLNLDWLKSLEQRYSWKPSDEQMKALHDLNLTGNISYTGQGQVLIELYNDLKRLRK